MISVGQLTLLSGGALVLTAALFLWRTFALPAACRRYGFAMVVACGGMSVTYFVTLLFPSLETTISDLIRFLSYTVIWAAMIPILGAVAGAGRRLTALLLGIVMFRVWVTYAAGFVDGALGTILTLSPFVALFAGIYLLYVSFERTSASTSGERRLLFSKLRNLVVLAWIALVINGLISAMALVDDLVSLVTLVYVEVVLLVGFGAILLRSVDALEETAAASTILPSRDADAEFDPESETNLAD
ncbi:rhodopsin [Natrialbaceae archaeon GCM10025810]|uniref:rhodopsin n=1 Tax=Halovalidus salilacus TaxID=3075124 RepID=UPI0036228A50